MRKTEILVNSEPLSDAPVMGHILVKRVSELSQMVSVPVGRWYDSIINTGGLMGRRLGQDDLPNGLSDLLRSGSEAHLSI